MVRSGRRLGYIRLYNCVWPSGQAPACVPSGHGFDSHPDGQGVCRSILLEPSGVGGGLSYPVSKYWFDFLA
jgi:hypothetical protein